MDSARRRIVPSVVGRILPFCRILPQTGNCQAVATKRGLAEFGRILDLREIFRKLYAHARFIFPQVLFCVKNILPRKHGLQILDVVVNTLPGLYSTVFSPHRLSLYKRVEAPP